MISVKPLNAEKFLIAALKYMERFKDHRLYEFVKNDFLAKTEQIDGGYGEWISIFLPYVIEKYQLGEKPHILDLGCGIGALTVLMNSLGFSAVGIDLHKEHLSLARILAEENGLPNTTFILGDGKRLPFEDNHFEIVLLFVVLEHLSDEVLEHLLPEIRRVCSGVVYVLVPNKLNIIDDHTGLKLIPWMPRWLAKKCVKMSGYQHQYILSEDREWDVYYRTFHRIVSIFKKHLFEFDLLQNSVIFPSAKIMKPLFISQTGGHLYTKPIYFILRQAANLALNIGLPKEALYPYLNLIFIPQKKLS